MDVFGHARITYLGLVQHSFGEVLKAEGQSARWTAPEVLAKNRTLSLEADVFSFAMVMTEVHGNQFVHLSRLTTLPVLFRNKVFTGKVPFDDDASVETMVAIMDGKRPSRPIHEALTDRLWGLMQQCWAQDPCERPQMSEVLKFLNPPPSSTPPPGMSL